MHATDRNGAARPSRFVPGCAICGLLLGLVGCLNPVPDDFPNDRETAPDESTVGPVGQGAAGGSGTEPDRDPAGGAVDEPGTPATQNPSPDVPGSFPDAGAPGDAGFPCDAGAERDAGVDVGEVQP